MEVWQTMIPTRLTPWIVTNNSNNIITGPRGLFLWLDGNFIKCRQLCSHCRGNHLHSVSLVSWNDQQLSNKQLYRFQHVLIAFWNPIISHSVTQYVFLRREVYTISCFCDSYWFWQVRKNNTHTSFHHFGVMCIASFPLWFIVQPNQKLQLRRFCHWL